MRRLTIGHPIPSNHLNDTSCELGRSALELDQRAIISEDTFTKKRRLEHYSEVFGHRFRASMKALTPNAHWLDLGAGLGNAATNYIDLKGPEKAAQISLLGYATPDQLALQHPGKVQVLSGRFIEDIPEHDFITQLMNFGDIDLVTDLYGVMSYTSDPGYVLSLLVRVLKRDGKMMFHMPSALSKDKIIAKGTSLTFKEWLCELRFLMITNLDKNTLLLELDNSYRELRIPQLHLVSRTNPNVPPPVRTFKENGLIHVIDMSQSTPEITYAVDI